MQNADSANGHIARQFKLVTQSRHLVGDSIHSSLTGQAVTAHDTVGQKAVIDIYLRIEPDSARRRHKHLGISVESRRGGVDEKRTKSRHDNAVMSRKKELDMLAYLYHIAKLINFSQKGK